MVYPKTQGIAATAGLRFEDFFEREYPSVTRALVLLTGNEGDAEDLAEEAFARAWARWGSIAGMGSPAGYVYRTALNLHRNRLRRLARELKHRQARTPANDLAEDAATRDAIRRALADLPVSQRAALLLVEWVGMSDDEAGRVLGIKAVSVRARRHRARATLRDRFGGPDA